MPPTPPTTELQAVERLVESLTKLSGTIPGMTERIAKAEASIEALSKLTGLDPSKIGEAIESLNAKYERLVDQIRKSAGFKIPGFSATDEKNFSLARAFAGVRACRGGPPQKDIFERIGAGFEFESCHAAREAATKAGHTAGNDESLGLMIPEEVMAPFIAAIYTKSVFIGLEGEGETRITVLDGLTGESASMTGFKGGIVAGYIVEGRDYTEQLVKAQKRKLTRKKLGAMIRNTIELSRSISPGIEAMIRRDLVRALAKALDRAIAYGTGQDGEPRGLFNNPEVRVYDVAGGKSYSNAAAANAAVTDWATGVLDYDGMSEMRGALEDSDIDPDEAGRTFSTVAHPKLFRNLRNLKTLNFSGQTAGQPYLLGSPMVRPETLRALIGDFAGTTQFRRGQLPGASIPGSATTATDTDAGDVVSGDLSEIFLGRWSGVEIEDDGGKGKLFSSDESLTKVRLFADHEVREPKAIVVSSNAEIESN
jgi:HK97 family phage major capsid protein